MTRLTHHRFGPDFFILEFQIDPLPAFAVISGGVLKPGKRGHISLVGVKVYLDENNNGERDPGEMRQTTSQTGYSFYHTPGGRFTVRLERVPPHVRPASAASSGVAVRGRSVNFQPIVLERRMVKSNGPDSPWRGHFIR